jgi:hypothetical protein
MVHRDNPKSAMSDNKHINFSNVMVTSEYNTMVLGASNNNGEVPTSGSSSGRGSFGKEPKVPTVLLLPHQHTLFCERKVKQSNEKVSHIIILFFSAYGLYVEYMYSNGCARRLEDAKNWKS